MANIIDYIFWRGDLPFKTHPFNTIDNVVFSMLSYFDFSGLVPDDFSSETVSLQSVAGRIKAEKSRDTFFDEPIVFKEFQHDFFKALAASDRYKHIRLAGYRNDTDCDHEKQFAALTIFPEDAPPYIAFRGTDSSMVGWKEDFNMALRKEIPSQLDASRYLLEYSQMTDGALLLGGHSKGGNLAVYAAAAASPKTQERILTIFTNDGPGFNTDIIQSAGFRQIRGKIYAVVPSSSVIGLLFEQDYPLHVVESTALGIAQHIPYSWLAGPSDFVYAKKVSERAVRFNEAVMAWIYGMDSHQRELFVEALYHIVVSADITSIEEFVEDWFSNTAHIVKSFLKSNPESKKVLVETISGFLGNIAKTQDKKKRHD